MQTITIIELPATFRVERTDSEAVVAAYFPKSRFTRADAERLAFAGRSD